MIYLFSRITHYLLLLLLITVMILILITVFIIRKRNTSVRPFVQMISSFASKHASKEARKELLINAPEARKSQTHSLSWIVTRDT